MTKKIPPSLTGLLKGFACRLFYHNLLCLNIVACDKSKDVNTRRHFRCRDTPHVSANGKNDAPRHVNHL